MTSWWMKEALLKFNSPCSLVIAAPSNSGKTYLTKQILENANGMFKESVTNILYCYGSVWQPIFDQLQSGIKNITFHEGIPDEQTIMNLTQHGKHVICVLDDLMEQASDSLSVQKLFTTGCHHLNMSIIYIIQNLLPRGRVARTLSLNSNYFILFRNPRDEQQIHYFARQAFANRKQYFLQSYSKATSEPHGYLLVDLNIHSDKKYQLRTHILPGQDVTIFTSSR